MTTGNLKINNINILTRSWDAKDPKANIILVHGYGEHSGRYAETAKQLNQIGCSVYSYDRRGEGKSEGPKADIKEINNHVKDFILYKDTLDLSSKPTFIFGHSLGGLIVSTYAIDYQPSDITGVILSSPLLKIDDDTAPILQKVAGLVARILPKLPTVTLDPQLISRNKDEVRKYEDDPLIYHGSTNARTGYAIIKAIKYVQANYAKFKLSVLVLHGSADKLADPKGSQWFYDSISSSDKTIKIFEGLFHEMMREPEKEGFFITITKWIAKRM